MLNICNVTCLSLITDSAEKNDSSEVSVDDDTKEVTSAEGFGAAAETENSKEDDTPSVEVADEPYVSQAFVEDVESVDDDNDSKGDATVEETDGESAEQQADDSKEDDDDQADKNSKDDEDTTKEEGDSKEDASADEQAAEQGKQIVAIENDDFTTVRPNNYKISKILTLYV